MANLAIPSFDALQCANRLKEAGVPPAHAEAQAVELQTAFDARDKALSAPYWTHIYDFTAKPEFFTSFRRYLESLLLQQKRNNITVWSSLHGMMRKRKATSENTALTSRQLHVSFWIRSRSLDKIVSKTASIAGKP